MANLVHTYQLIADILNVNDTTIDTLTLKLKTEAIDWDSVVVEGSKHLVLPALYCRLKSKHVISYLPQELQDYLKAITSINRNRNKAILKQALDLSQLLTTHKIDHVFLKGTALCATNYFEDNAERMIGDIDILIEKTRLNEAYALLEKQGYTGVKTTLGTDFFEHKHLPRLISKDHIGAVELHLKLFMTYQLDALSAEHILKHKNQNFDINIPSNTHLLMHNILNYEVNDFGKLYHTINFRAAYDTIVLLPKINTAHLKQTFNKTPFKSYLKKLNLFFSSLHEAITLKPTLVNTFYLVRLKYRLLYVIHYKGIKTLSFTKVLLHRVYMFGYNTKYRKAVWNDRARIIKALTK
ncbi:nucleotidyltransferase family protein [uncultured Winogradskyella sp.]|mgnify:CR=1 FL=1|uniref:nucleotidyltransferase family protein n=1 Tax=uncultured Winogradskyella sp. TaxID=395353 RepID=UPI0030DDBDA1|tara:strand:+ start:33064 stop:34122 length:1059 start_codon:yes stop_codon:yes gene_type:complete